MDRCAACGAPSSGQAFCAACGSDLRGQAAGAHWQAAATAYPGQSGYPAPGYAGYPQAQPQRSPVWVAVAGALVLAGLACIVAWFALGRTEARPAAAPAQVAATPAPTQAPSVAVPAATPAPGGQANAPAPAPATVTSSVTVARRRRARSPSTRRPRASCLTVLTCSCSTRCPSRGIRWRRPTARLAGSSAPPSSTAATRRGSTPATGPSSTSATSGPSPMRRRGARATGARSADRATRGG